MAGPFLMFPDKRLKTPAAPVAAVDDDLRALWQRLLKAMYGMPGVGLAAPQIGVGLRAIVADASDTRDQPLRMANPRIVWASDETAAQREGSPNLPGLFADVTRPASVTVAYLDMEGAEAERSFTGLWAASVQHNIDHLDGLMFIDRLGPVKRRMLLARHAKTQRRGTA